MKHQTRKSLFVVAICFQFLIPSFSFGQTSRSLVECYELIGHEKALKIARTQYSVIKKAYDEMKGFSDDIFRIVVKIGGKSLSRELNEKGWIQGIFNAYVEDKITLDEAETMVKAIPILIMATEFDYLMACYKASLVTLRDCIDKHESALERERREARDILDSGDRGTRPVEKTKCDDPTGSWVQTFTDGSLKGRGSTWIITANESGGFDARERGLGGARGTATFSGKVLRIEWYTGSKEKTNEEGFYEWTLDSTCTSGTGTHGVTKGRRAAFSCSTSVKRL